MFNLNWSENKRHILDQHYPIKTNTLILSNSLKKNTWYFNKLVWKKCKLAMPQVQGQSSLYSWVISDFVKTPRAGDRHGDTGRFVCAIQACVFSEAQDVLLNKGRRVEAWLRRCLIHRTSLGGLTLTNKPIQNQRTCCREVITNYQEITGLSLCRLFLFDYTWILSGSVVQKQMDSETNTMKNSYCMRWFGVGLTGLV